MSHLKAKGRAGTKPPRLERAWHGTKNSGGSHQERGGGGGQPAGKIRELVCAGRAVQQGQDCPGRTREPSACLRLGGDTIGPTVLKVIPLFRKCIAQAKQGGGSELEEATEALGRGRGWRWGWEGARHPDTRSARGRTCGPRMSTSPRAPGRPLPAAARVRPQGFWGHVPYLRGAGWRRAQPGRGLQGTNLRSVRAGIPWGASAAGSGAATTGARRRRFGRRRVARATDIPRAAGALQDACRLATPGCHHAPRGARVTCLRRHRPTRRSVAMTTTSCTPVPMTTSPAPRAARGCSSRPPEPGRSARLPHRERRRPSPPCPRRRTAADRAQSFGEIRNDTGRGRPGFRRPQRLRGATRRRSG